MVILLSYALLTRSLSPLRVYMTLKCETKTGYTVVGSPVDGGVILSEDQSSLGARTISSTTSPLRENRLKCDIMRIISRSVVLFCFINLVRGQTEANEAVSEVLGDSGRWSERITKINRKKPIGVPREDSSRQTRRWEEEATGDSKRRPRPLAFTLRVPDIREGFESQREENFRKGEERKVVREPLDWRVSEPSPILLPPYGSSSPSPAGEGTFDTITDLQPPWKNESSRDYGENSSVENAMREIATLNSLRRGESDESPPTGYGDDSSRGSEETDNESGWVDIAKKSSSNATKTRSQQAGRGRNPSGSFYIDEAGEGAEGPTTTTKSNHSGKNPRGSRKYQHDFHSVKTFPRKQKSFSSGGKHDWQQRRAPGGQRSNHFRFTSDTSAKVGAVPGVPGRDYPVHQEHTHHNLRNVADRFPCPTIPKTHVYLADRASRCQIFYVCYGSETGVPMVCPNGTLFSEPLQVCDWWFNVSC